MKFHFAYLIIESFKAAQLPAPLIRTGGQMGQPLWDGKKQEKETRFYACDVIS